MLELGHHTLFNDVSRLYFKKEFNFRVMKGHYKLFFKKKAKLLANN